MRVVVHIGTEKTGTTSIQHFLKANRGRLEEVDFFSPRSVGELDQQALATMGLPDSPVLWHHRKSGLLDPSSIARYKERTTRLLRAELADQAHRTVLVSSEQLSVMLQRDEDVERFADWLRGFFDDIAILVYLRRQDEFLVSLYSTTIKAGGTKRFSIPEKGQTGPGSKFDYLDLLERWARFFGEQRLIVRVFDRTQLVDHDVVQDFRESVHLPHDSDLVVPGFLNERADSAQVEFLRRFNEYVPKQTPSGTRNPLRRGVARTVMGGAGKGQPIGLPVDVAQEFVGRFAKGNAEIAERFLGRPDGRLFGDYFRAGSPPGSDGLEVDTAVEIAAELWTAAQHELASCREELGRLRAERGQGHGSRRWGWRQRGL